jgi:phosphoadenosine phosphosulfate reductase
MPRPFEHTLSAPAPAGLIAKAVALEALHGDKPADRLLEAVLADKVAGSVAIVSSFGAESAVLLHLAAGVDPAVPVIFIDTRRLFPETLAYRDALIRRLGLTDVRTIGPTASDEERLDPRGALFATDPDRCCHFRKVVPLASELQPFAAWVSGRKRHQAVTRSALPIFEADAAHLKVNPLATWTPQHIAAYARAHDLPAHPLVARGYPSIGCMPCTTPVNASEDGRAGRWRDQDKIECGIHVVGGAAGRGGH